MDKGDRPNGGAGAKDGDATTEPGTSRRAADPAGWRTLWRDDFTGLDRTRWNVRHYGQAPNQAALFMRENVKVDDGFLHLRAKKQVVQRWNYTSGYIDSNGKAALPDEFRVEVRAKVPMERGLWPGPLWLRPDDRSAGEIDLVEIFGRELDDPATHHTIHTAYGPGREQEVHVKKFSALPGTADGWHTYSMEKTPGSIKMWVDDVPVATFTSGDPSWFDTYYEVGKRWNLRVTLNVGGEWNGMPDHTTDWSASESVMHLDYIHTWVRD
ncbi:glycoside hydrolase family 16 protein [Nocardioides sp. CCNWLW239]|uniref:glycoside hydrolase family 16 protein n=1 Tax=Nocardioides sp. CCNWLW239 TaxID=3128902 RepID=UPI003017640A